jgi:hypothetical protein
MRKKTLKQMLIKLGAYEQFKANFRDHQEWRGIYSHYITQSLAYALRLTVEDRISVCMQYAKNSFKWDNSPEGTEYWGDVWLKVVKMIRENE